MARRAIKELYLELAALRSELNIAKQQIRVSLRPRLGLDQLVPESSERLGMNPDAPVFVPTLAEESLGPVPLSGAGGHSMEADKPVSDDSAVHRHSSFGQYYKCNFKQVEVFSLAALKGHVWERLPEDHALDRAIQSYHKRDFMDVSRLMDSYPLINDNFCKILPLFIQTEEQKLIQLEAHFAENQRQIEANLQEVCDVRDSASKCQQRRDGRTASGALLRDAESLIARHVDLKKQLTQEKAGMGRQLVHHRLRLNLLQKLAPALAQRLEDDIEGIQKQWEKLGV